VPDTGFQRILLSDEPPALRAAEVLAGLAVVAREQPSLARGVAIVNPSRWDAPDALVNGLMTGLRGNALVKPVTVDGLGSDVPVAGGRARVLQSRAPATAPITAQQFAAASASLGAVHDLLRTDNDAKAALVARGDRALYASLSSAWQTPDGRNQARAL